ncbi:MAG: helix-turn-helix transcriptional regulator [Clostridia bacterium]|nr:helix-turn-helix transcriptional regulator [Clostridia bacterium]
MTTFSKKDVDTLTYSDTGDGALQLSFDPFVLTTGMFTPGAAASFCARIPDEDRRRLGFAELSYYRGDVETAHKEFDALQNSDALSTVTAAMLGRAIASFSLGEPKELLEMYRRAREINNGFEEGSPFRKMTDLFLLYFNVLIRNLPEIVFPAVGVGAFNVPDSLKPMAFYCYTYYLLAAGDIGRAIGMAEGALIFAERPCPVSEIYLCMNIATGYTMRLLWDKAEYYFRYAWELAKPDGLIMPFAEHRGSLSGLLERCLRYQEPEAYRRILAMSNRYHKGWAYVHNLITGDQIADRLTAIEYNVASLVAKGLSNTQTAEILGITVNSVRTHLRNIFNKLDVTGRKELKKYVI